MKKGDKMNHWKCTKCSYVYKPERGDWIHDIEKGTPFEELPEDWKCPTCGQPKFLFEEVIDE